MLAARGNLTPRLACAGERLPRRKPHAPQFNAGLRLPTEVHLCPANLFWRRSIDSSGSNRLRRRFNKRYIEPLNRRENQAEALKTHYMGRGSGILSTQFSQIFPWARGQLRLCATRWKI